MSYINDALRKAQQEKNNRYGVLDCTAADAFDPQRKIASKRAAALVVAAILLTASITAATLFFRSYFAEEPVADKHRTEMTTKTGDSSPPEAVKNAAVEAARTDRPVVAGSVSAKEPAAVPAGGGESGRHINRDAVAIPAPARTGAIVAQPRPAKPELQKGVVAKGTKTSAGKGKTAQAANGGDKAAGLYGKAVRAQREGSLKEAEKLYRELLAFAPAHVGALNNLGVVCLAEGKRQAALEFFRRAILLKPDYVDPYYNIACLYAQGGDIDQSLWHLRMAISLDAEVKQWAQTDADLRNVAASPKFRELMEGQKTDAAGANK